MCLKNGVNPDKLQPDDLDPGIFSAILGTGPRASQIGKSNVVKEIITM